MDPAPREYDDLPRDEALGRPLPFACGTPGGDRAASATALDGRRVTQCALSRICGVCGQGLGRPIAFLGSRSEVDRNAFHFPPSHQDCAERLASDWAGVTTPVLGQAEPVEQWQVVLTAGFEFVRPGREQEDRRPVFCPNSLIPA